MTVTSAVVPVVVSPVRGAVLLDADAMTPDPPVVPDMTGDDSTTMQWDDSESMQWDDGEPMEWDS